MPTLRLMAALLCAGCAGSTSSRSDPAPDISAIVVRGSEMSGTLLDGLRTHVPTMKVDQGGGQCPSIMFRGPRSIRNQQNPSVYVDGTLMLDTCILTQIPSHDVETVEVFPSGITSKPGILRNPFGVIVVQRLRH